MITTTPQQLRRAADIAETIESLREELSQILGDEISIPPVRTDKRKRHKMSAAGRAAISAAAKARWAKLRSGKKTAKSVRKPKRKMSGAAKVKLSAIAKARWVKARKAGQSKL